MMAFRFAWEYSLMAYECLVYLQTLLLALIHVYISRLSNNNNNNTTTTSNNTGGGPFNSTVLRKLVCI